MAPLVVLGLVAEKAVQYGPEVVRGVRAIIQSLQGEHPELRGPLPSIRAADEESFADQLERIRREGGA